MANYLHRITSLSNFVTFSRVFIPLTRQQSTVNLRKQLTFYDFTSQAPLPLYSSRYIVDSRFTVKSLHSRSRFSPERAYFSGSFRSKARAFSSKELRLTEVSSDFEMTETEASNSFPIASWSPEAEELYDRLQKDLIQNGNGDWLAHQLLSSSIDGETRLFTKAAILELPGKFFEYQLFYNTKEQRVKGVIQFGPFTEGPVGCVHGGASAAMMDSAIGVCVNKCIPGCVTASLTTNYKSLLPLGSTVLVESWIEKVEGRKIYAAAQLKSPDDKVTYVTANALFIQFQAKAKLNTQL